MTMNLEQVHRYPRVMVQLVELLAALAVMIALTLAARDLLRVVWVALGVDPALFVMLPWLQSLVVDAVGYVPIEGIGLVPALSSLLPEFLPTLIWLALALLLGLVLRNSLPVIRTSARGMLVEFAGSWIALPWEGIRAIKVTESAERFVLLVEVDARYLTDWHRCYSLIYRLGLRRGLLITSMISDFEILVRTMLAESDRVARVLDGVRPAQLQEDASSPLFRLLLSPKNFFMQGRRADVGGQAVAPDAVTQIVSETGVVSSYPRRLALPILWLPRVLAAVVIVQYAVQVLTFLTLAFPVLQALPGFSMLDLRLPQPAWWAVIASTLMLVLALVLVAVLANALPALEARKAGLALRVFGQWRVIPWAQIVAVKVTEFSEQSQVILIQTNRGLPFTTRLVSLLYDGTVHQGVLLTSAIDHFEPLLQRIIMEVMHSPGERTATDEAPIFQSNARSELLLLSFAPGQAIDRHIADLRQDERSTAILPRQLLGPARTMAALALLPPLLLFVDRALMQQVLPDARLFLAMILLFLLGMLEWLLVCFAAIALDETTGGDEEGGRALYLYPYIQLPRLLPILGAILVALLGIPVLPALAWLSAIAMTFFLAAGLWEGLYGWSRGLLLAAGLIPVLYQLILLVGYLVVRV